MFFSFFFFFFNGETCCPRAKCPRRPRISPKTHSRRAIPVEFSFGGGTCVLEKCTSGTCMPRVVDFSNRALLVRFCLRWICVRFVPLYAVERQIIVIYLPSGMRRDCTQHGIQVATRYITVHLSSFALFLAYAHKHVFSARVYMYGVARR